LEALRTKLRPVRCAFGRAFWQKKHDHGEEAARAEFRASRGAKFMVNWAQGRVVLSYGGSEALCQMIFGDFWVTSAIGFWYADGAQNNYPMGKVN
jgi:hypothetical protein